MTRRISRAVRVGGIMVGGGAPVSVQSMLNVPATDIAGSVAQARALEAAGCDIIRAAVPDKAAAGLIAALKEAVAAPIVADIHFDYRLALEAVAAGADKIRLNPGNIGGAERVRAVAAACRARGVPIRIGVNGGSLEPDILARHGGGTAAALCESALRHIALLEACDFGDIVVSLKSSHVAVMFEAYEQLAAVCDYPLHLGVTEAGTERMGLLKSAAGIGGLLLRGIGDTVRVSLTADPAREVAAARDLLRALGLRREGAELIACPTCGRTRIDLVRIAAEVEERLRAVDISLRVAVMGCAVNGPGEARDADIGIAGGDGKAVLFKRGEVFRTLPEGEIVEALMEEIGRMTVE